MPEVPVTSIVGIPNSGGGTEWWQLTDSWKLLRTDPPSTEMASNADVIGAIATHSAIPSAHHPVNVGISGSKVVGGYKLTFTNGLLTGFEQV